MPTDLPDSIFFFPNGTAAVCDYHGRQMPRYQCGWHGCTIESLAADGIDWTTIPNRMGSPASAPPPWWDARRQRRHEAWMAAGRPDRETWDYEEPTDDA